MIAFDGASCAVHSASLGAVGDFTLSLWMATAAEAAGALLGSDYGIGHEGVSIKIRTDKTGSTPSDGAEAAGKASVRLRHNSGAYTIGEFAAGALFDGAVHSLIVRRSGASIAVYVDGAGQTLTYGHNTLGAAAITLSRPLALGAIYHDDGIGEAIGPEQFCMATVGEFALFLRALSAAEIGELAAGFSPLFASPLPEHHWAMVESDGGVQEIGAATWDVGQAGPVQYDAEVDLARPGSPHDGAAALGGRRYELYAAAGRRPDPAIDEPIALLPRTVTSVSLLAGGLGLVANVPHVVAVYAANEQGRAASAPVATFAVDGDGGPLMAPAAATGLRVTPRAGGLALVQFDYVDPLNSLAPAVSFEIALTPLTSGVATPAAITVAPAASDPIPPRYAVVVGPLDEGLWRVVVRSISVGGAATVTPSGIEFRADASAPEAAAAGVEAVSIAV